MSRRGISQAELLVAIKMVLLAKEPKRKVSIDFKIPRSSLIRYVSNVEREIHDIAAATDDEILDVLDSSTTMGPSFIFSRKQEKVLMDYIFKCNDLYHGVSVAEVKRLAFQFAKKVGISYPVHWNEDSMAGRKWFNLFLKRHPTMSVLTTHHMSLNRKRGFNRDSVAYFFANLDRVTDETNYGPHSTWNMDESGCSTVPTKIGKLIFRKGSKHAGRTVAQERGTLVTMVACVSAAASVIPPFFIFPRKRMQSHYLDRAMPGSIGACNESGWMQQKEFVIFMKHFIRFTGASLLRPQLLLLDNHDSRLSIEAIDLANDHGVTMLFFPSHCSHRPQPLDVSVFGPLKACYKKECLEWTNNNADRAIEIYHIPEIVSKCFDEAFTPINIKAGFTATGIYPINSGIFTDSDFTVAEMSDENIVQHGKVVVTENQRLITFNDASVANVKVLKSEPSTSGSTLRTAMDSGDTMKCLRAHVKRRKLIKEENESDVETVEEEQSLIINEPIMDIETEQNVEDHRVGEQINEDRIESTTPTTISIDNSSVAVQYLKALQEYAMLHENFRAIGLLMEAEKSFLCPADDTDFEL